MVFKSTSKIAFCVALTAVTLGSDSRADDNRMLEEVIVSAEKRNENVQDVPISIVVVSGDEISALNLFDFVETAQLTPGIALTSGLQAAAIR